MRSCCQGKVGRCSHLQRIICMHSLSRQSFIVSALKKPCGALQRRPAAAHDMAECPETGSTYQTFGWDRPWVCSMQAMRTKYGIRIACGVHVGSGIGC